MSALVLFILSAILFLRAAGLIKRGDHLEGLAVFLGSMLLLSAGFIVRAIHNAVAVLGFAPAFALAEAQREETMLVAQVQSVNETGTEITLTDGTKLRTPPGSVLRPGVFEEGTMVIAMYREENGDKILTKLSPAESAPAPSTPSKWPRGSHRGNWPSNGRRRARR